MTMRSAGRRIRLAASLLALLGIGLAASACSGGSGQAANGAPQSEIVITKQVWAWYQQYVGEGMPGAFAVSRDGRRAQYVYCANSEALTAARPCQNAQISQQARISCGDDCVIFAEGSSIIVPYRVE